MKIDNSGSAEAGNIYIYIFVFVGFRRGLGKKRCVVVLWKSEVEGLLVGI